MALLNESFIDNLWTIKILGMLITPFEETKAYELGIIDEHGTALKKVRDLRSQEEKSAYDMLDRFVFNIKKIINKLPGGESRLKNLTAAYFLVKENRFSLYETVTEFDVDSITDEQVNYIIGVLEDMATVGGPVHTNPDTSTMPSNRTGKSVSTDKPKITKRKQYKFVKRKK